VTSALHLYLLTRREHISFGRALGKGAGSAVAFSMSVCVIWPVVALLTYHMRLLLFNITTIEQVSYTIYPLLYGLGIQDALLWLFIQFRPMIAFVRSVIVIICQRPNCNRSIQYSRYVASAEQVLRTTRAITRSAPSSFFIYLGIRFAERNLLITVFPPLPDPKPSAQNPNSGSSPTQPLLARQLAEKHDGNALSPTRILVARCACSGY
jgi:hypothetical protein